MQKPLPSGQHNANHFLPTIGGGTTPLTSSEKIAMMGKRNGKKGNPKKKRKLMATAKAGLHIIQPNPSTYAYPAANGKGGISASS